MRHEAPETGRPRSSASDEKTSWYAPSRSLGVAIGVLLTLVTLLVSVSALLTFAYRYPAPWSVLFGGLGLAGLVATVIAGLWTAGLATLRYAVRGSVAYVQWGGSLLRIPLDEVEIVPAAEAGPLGGYRGLIWPGSAIGFAESERYGLVALIATLRSPDRLLLLATPTLTIGLTIDPNSDFAGRLRRVHRGRRSADDPSAAPGFWRSLPLSEDRLFWVLITLGALAALLHWGLALSKADLVTDTVRYLGAVRVESPDDLVTLAGVGAAIWCVDLLAAGWLHAWDRFAARFLAFAGLVSQIIVLLALAALGS